MKKTNRIIKFVTVVTMMAGSLNVNATDFTKDRSSNYLLPETKVEFASFMNARAKVFLLKNDAAWETFNEVLTSYNTSRSAFMEMNNVEKHNFLKASNAIQIKLDKMIGTKAEDWKRAVKQTTGIYKFAWESVVKERDLIDVNSIEVPGLPQMDAKQINLINKFNWGTDINESDLIDVDNITVPELSL